MFYLIAGVTTILVLLVIFCKYPNTSWMPSQSKTTASLACTKWQHRKYIIYSLSTTFVFLCFALFYVVFQASPPTPPSAAQEATLAPIESSPFLHSIKRLFLNLNYIFLLISYGMNVGVFYAISTLLNRVRARYRIIRQSEIANQITINGARDDVTNSSILFSLSLSLSPSIFTPGRCDDMRRLCCCTIQTMKWMLVALDCALCWLAWWAQCAVASFWIKRIVSSKLCCVRYWKSIWLDEKNRNFEFICFFTF